MKRVTTLFQTFGLLPSQPDIHLLVQATEQACVLEVLKLLIPGERICREGTDWQTEEEINTQIQRYAALTQSEWQADSA